jgi:hypothetical protein
MVGSEAALAKIRGVFPYTSRQSKAVAQPPPGSEGRSFLRRVGGEEGVFSPGSGRFPGAFKVMRPWLPQGKNTLASGPGGAYAARPA